MNLYSLPYANERKLSGMKYGYLLVAFCVVVGIGGSSLAHAAGAQVLKRAEFKPTLSIGSTWMVEVSAMSEAPSLPTERLVDWRPSKFSVVYQFAVEAIEDIDSENCYRVRIDHKSLNGKPHDGMPIEYWRIYLRQAGLTLKKVERLDGKTGRVKKSRLFADGPVDATDWGEFLPLVFPSFQEGEFDKAPQVKKTKDRSERSRSLDRCIQIEEPTRILVDGKVTDSLRMTLERCDSVESSHVRRSTQTWIKGRPWWTEATYERDGRQWCSARLLKD